MLTPSIDNIIFRPPKGSPAANTTLRPRDISDKDTINFSGGLPGTKYTFWLYYSNSSLSNWLTWQGTIHTTPDPPNQLSIDVQSSKVSCDWRRSGQLGAILTSDWSAGGGGALAAAQGGELLRVQAEGDPAVGAGQGDQEHPDQGPEEHAQGIQCHHFILLTNILTYISISEINKHHLFART